MQPASSSRLIEPDEPLDVRRTLAAFRVTGSDPSIVIGAGEIWRATRTPEGAATLRLRPAGGELFAVAVPQVVAVDGWGPGAPWAVDRAHELLGLQDRPDSFAPGEGLVGRLHRRHRGLRFGASRAVVEMLIPTILEQKVTTIEAHRSYRGLVWALGEPAPGPAGEAGLRLRPDPARLAELGYADLHRFGIERRRAETIRRVSRLASRLDGLALDVDTPSTEGGGPASGTQSVPVSRTARLQRGLLSIPGVGPWTTAIVAQQALGDPDAVVVGDYHLPSLVTHSLAGERRGTDERMLELLAPYEGHRARVVRLLTLGGRHVPRRTPKARLRAIASI